MNPDQFSLAAFNPFIVNVLMSPLLVHCAKIFNKFKKVQELGEIEKEATLHPHATDTDDHNESTTASMTNSTGDEENHRCERNSDGRI